jgi:two-component system, NarL family, invasion response regulator UvrY
VTDKRLRILVADDHAIVRVGLKRLLEDLQQTQEVGEAKDGDEALKLARAAHWDVLVLDIEMPGQDPMTLLRLLRTEKPDIAVLVLSAYSEDEFAIRALKAGAAGYITKSSPADQITAAILAVANGGLYISDKLLRRLAEYVRTRPAESAHDLLSDREFSVLRGIADAKTLAEIAEELKLNVKTVTSYRRRLLAKLGMENNVELARYALQHGLAH